MSERRLVFPLLLVLDFVCVEVVFQVVGWLRAAVAVGSFEAGPLVAGVSDFRSLLGPFAVLCLALYLIDGYSSRTDMLSAAYASLHVIALVTGMLVMLMVTYVFIKDQYALQSSRAVIAFGFLLLIPVTLTYRRWLSLRMMNTRHQRPILFLGNQGSCVAFKATCRTNQLSQEVIYIATDASHQDSIAPMLEMEMQAVTELPQILDKLAPRLEAIVLHRSARDLPGAVVEKLMELHFHGVSTYTLELFHEIYWRKIPLEELDPTWLFQEGFQIARQPVFARLKRLSDIVLALLGLVVCSPLLLLCAAAVWLEDRGAIFFLQTRIGLNHVPFQIVKFRTMRPSDGGGDPYTRPGDARVTRVGRLLRATRLDEFPQLWSVLRGDMSLIGPRAEWSKLVERYEREIPCYHFRHLMKPGITGWAQVNYPYGANLDDTLRKLEYDLYYLRYFSFVLDASIVLKTIHIILFGKGR